jgi:hypothetical protein
VKEPTRQTITRRADEPRIAIGDSIPIKEGVIGVVLARYTPSGKENEIRYIVELRPDETLTR